MLLAIPWDVSREIFTIGPVTLRWYGLLFASGFLLGYFITRKIFRTEKQNEEWLDSLLVYLVVGTVIGARLGHVLFYNPGYYFSNPQEILMIWHGGLASHGGTIGVLIAIWLWSKRVSKKPFFWITDRLVMSVALACCFIRLGNLMNSEILGVATDLPWAFKFLQLEVSEQFARHPAQLYESLSYLSIFGILSYLFWKTDFKEKAGFLSGLFLVLLFGARFVIEYVKIEQADFQAGFLETFTMGQWLSIPFILLGAVFMYLGTKPPKTG